MLISIILALFLSLAFTAFVVADETATTSSKLTVFLTFALLIPTIVTLVCFGVRSFAQEIAARL